MGIAAAEVGAAIVAGGRARRLGGRIKPLLEIDGETILSRELAVLGARFTEIVISAADPAPFADVGLPVILDRVAGAGPLAGIAAVLAATRRRFVFAVAGDMPYLSVDAIDTLLGAGSADADVVIPVSGGYPEPLHALYARRCLPTIERHLADGRYQVSGLLSAPELNVITVDADTLGARVLTNINSPLDLPSDRS